MSINEIDPEPFGPSADKPLHKTACRVVSCGPNPSVKHTARGGFEPVISVGMETPFCRFEMCLDEHSANFLAAAIPLYLK